MVKIKLFIKIESLFLIKLLFQCFWRKKVISYFGKYLRREINFGREWKSQKDISTQCYTGVPKIIVWYSLYNPHNNIWFFESNLIYLILPDYGAITRLWCLWFKHRYSHTYVPLLGIQQSKLVLKREFRPKNNMFDETYVF